MGQTDPEKTLSKSWNSPPLQSSVPAEQPSPGDRPPAPRGTVRAALGSAGDAPELDGASGPSTLGEPGAGVGRRRKGAPRRPQRRRMGPEVGGLAEVRSNFLHTAKVCFHLSLLIPLIV